MINYTLIALCLLNLLFGSSYRIKVFNSAIISFIPQLKLHKIVTVKKEKGRKHQKFHYKASNFDNISLNDFYVFDYSPKEQPSFIDYIKMFLGCELPGIIRVIHIEKTTEKNLIADWNNVVKTNPDYKKFLHKFGDKRVDNIIEKWKGPFNVYSQNCRHFSKYFTKEINKINEFDSI